MNPVLESQSLEERIRALADEAVAGSDLYVVEVQVRGRTGSRVVEVYIDSDEGVGLDNIAETSRRLSFLLDTEDPVKGKYNLHVSSPGADRPLVSPRQYPRHIGRKLRLTIAGEPDDTTVAGTLETVEEEGITLKKDAKAAPQHFSFSEIREAHVALPW